MLFKPIFPLVAAVATLTGATVSDDITNELLGSRGAGDIRQWISIKNGFRFETTTGTQVPKFRAAAMKWPTTEKIGTVTENPPSSNKQGYRAYCFPQSLSHFDEQYATQKFCQRYWIETQYYQEGGPIIVFDLGEQAADNFMNKLGHFYQIAQRHNGIAIVLEHRYYGWSVPVDDLTTDNLRWLSNEEALEDSANFIRNWQPVQDIKVNVSDPTMLHPDKTPWIYMGGSYPGARAALMRIKYPDIVFGAIASSAVTQAKLNFPEYQNAAMTYGPPDCINAMRKAVNAMDVILEQPEPAPTMLKEYFGLEALNNDEFAVAVMFQSMYWQGNRTWFVDHWCPSLLAPINGTTFSSKIQKPSGGTNSNSTDEEGDISIIIPSEVASYERWSRVNVVQACKGSLKECYGNADEFYQVYSLDETWRLWFWQVCNEFGWFQTGYEMGQDSLLTHRKTLDWSLHNCQAAFPPGQHFSIPEKPTLALNLYGGYDAAADRLAFIDGEIDAWRYVTPNSPIAKPRVSSDIRPMFVVTGGNHCPDTWIRPNEVGSFQAVHDFEFAFVDIWLKQWSTNNGAEHGNCSNHDANSVTGHGRGKGKGHSGRGNGRGRGKGKHHDHDCKFEFDEEKERLDKREPNDA